MPVRFLSGLSVRRDTRLVLLTITVSAVGLLLLARLRFPASPAPEPLASAGPAPAPLERLAARATYEDLAEIVRDLRPRLLPAITVLPLRIEPVDGTPVVPPSDPRLFAAAVRIRDDLALSLIPAGTDVAQAPEGGDEVATLVARDPVTGLAVVRLPSQAPVPIAPSEQAAVRQMGRYVALVEPGPGVPLVRPMFLAQSATVSDIAWNRPLVPVGPAALAPPGALVFSLDGALVGAVVHERDYALVVPAPSLLEAFDRLMHDGAEEPGSLGVDLQDLTPQLAAATGAGRGAVIAQVDPDGPAAGHLEPGDVLVTIDGRAISSLEEARLRIARTRPGTASTVGILRAGQALDVSIDSQAGTPRGPARPDTELGVLLGASQGGARVLRVSAATAAARAGLAAGDVITRFGAQSAPTVRQVLRGFAAVPGGTHVLLTVARDGRNLVLAVEKR